MTDSTIRDELTASQENSRLFNDTGGDQFYYDKGGLNIGFGFNITLNNNADFLSNVFNAGGVNFSPTQIDAIQSDAESPASISGDDTSLAVALSFTGINQAQA